MEVGEGGEGRQGENRIGNVSLVYAFSRGRGCGVKGCWCLCGCWCVSTRACRYMCITPARHERRSIHACIHPCTYTGPFHVCIHVHTCCVLICILYVHTYINMYRALWKLAATQRIPQTTAPRACHPRVTNSSSRAPCTHQSHAFALHQRPSLHRRAAAVIDNVCHADWALGEAGP